MIWLNNDILKNPPVSTYCFGKKLDTIIRVFFLLLIFILVHRDLIQKYANLVLNISLQSQDSINYEPLLPHPLLSSVISTFIKFDI